MKSLSKIFTSDVFIQEGVSPESNVLVVACTLGDDYDNPQNRIAIKNKESWLEFIFFGEEVISVDATSNGQAYVLGENGTVIQFDWRITRSREELLASVIFVENNTVETPLRCLRIVGNEIFCGGSCGQMYRFKKGKFYSLPELIIDGEEQTIEDISGTSADDLVVVTSEGHCANFDGKVWHSLDIPTNVELTSICKFGDKYAIAGYNGTILVGKNDKWEILPDTDTERKYWGIASRNETLYASHSGGIDLVNGEKKSALKIPKMKDPEFSTLRTGPDGVWSCHGRTIGIVTDAGWQTIEI